MSTDIDLYIGFAQRDEWHNWAGTYARHTALFERVSGRTCLVVPYYAAGSGLINRISPRAVIMSGFARSFQDYDVDSFAPVCDWLQSSHNQTPTLALCGSHQLLGFLFNGEMKGAKKLYDEPMRMLKCGEAITNPDYHPEYFMETGFYHLSLTDAGKYHPLFAGFDVNPIVRESHYCEIKSLPPQFVLLASTPECRIQAMAHESRQLLGLQFHPEDSTERFPDGIRILENFYRMARGASRREAAE